MASTLMRRLLAILLLAVFGAILSAPAIAAQAEQLLPACCRKGGAHRCEMHKSMSSQAGAGPQFAAIQAKCPCCPLMTASLHIDTSTLAGSGRYVSTLVAQPAIVAQAQAGFRLSSIRTRQKRGPPTILFS